MGQGTMAQICKVSASVRRCQGRSTCVKVKCNTKMPLRLIGAVFILVVVFLVYLCKRQRMSSAGRSVQTEGRVVPADD